MARDNATARLFWCRKELAHVIRRDRSSAAARYAWLLGYLGLVLAGAGLTVTALAAAPQLAGPSVLATMGAAVAFLGLRVAFDRREEIAADLFAVGLTRDLDAATELMRFYEENVARPVPDGGLGRAWARLERRWFATHPEPQARLAAMRRHLVDQVADYPSASGHGQRPRLGVVGQHSLACEHPDDPRPQGR